MFYKLDDKHKFLLSFKLYSSLMNLLIAAGYTTYLYITRGWSPTTTCRENPSLGRQLRKIKLQPYSHSVYCYWNRVRINQSCKKFVRQKNLLYEKVYRTDLNRGVVLSNYKENSLWRLKDRWVFSQQNPVKILVPITNWIK